MVWTRVALTATGPASPSQRAQAYVVEPVKLTAARSEKGWIGGMPTGDSAAGAATPPAGETAHS